MGEGVEDGEDFLIGVLELLALGVLFGVGEFGGFDGFDAGVYVFDLFFGFLDGVDFGFVGLFDSLTGSLQFVEGWQDGGRG